MNWAAAYFYQHWLIVHQCTKCPSQVDVRPRPTLKDYVGWQHKHTHQNTQLTRHIFVDLSSWPKMLLTCLWNGAKKIDVSILTRQSTTESIVRKAYCSLVAGLCFAVPVCQCADGTVFGLRDTCMRTNFDITSSIIVTSLLSLVQVMFWLVVVGVVVVCRVWNKYLHGVMSTSCTMNACKCLHNSLKIS